MDSLSTLNPLLWRADVTNDPAYLAGNAAGWLSRSEKHAATSYPLAGRLYVAKSGWLLLSVPNALVRGVFDALTAPGAELPLAGTMNVPNVPADLLNAHISVMTADEVASIGADKINERGHHFGYTLGPIREIDVKSVGGVSKVWAVQVSSPALATLRKSYGLSPLPKGDQPFHITVAVRRKKVLQDNEVGKFESASGRGELKAAAEHKPELPWRERVEVFTKHPRTGKIYGGVWDNDKSFAAPGGGIDPGETPEQAAVRELAEETGIEAANPVLLPFPPVDNPWSDEYRASKGRNFAGSRTHFVLADFVRKNKNKNLDFWAANARKFYRPEQALELMQNKTLPSVGEARMRALQHIIDTTSKKQAADELHGGAADGMPDSKFPQKALAEGAKHEHEHTDDDQIAKEIAKDHLQEDPAYYEKVKEIEKGARVKIIDELLAAKKHSDNKRYDHKTQILRRLMEQSPQDWVVDDAAPKFPGITHTPTKFRFHTDRTAIPSGVKSANSVYLDQLKNLPFSKNFTYDFNKPVFENIQNHARQLKQRGDWILQARRNEQLYRSAIDPHYRHQLAMQAFYGQMPQPAYIDRLIEQYGNNFLGSGR